MVIIHVHAPTVGYFFFHGIKLLATFLKAKAPLRYIASQENAFTGVLFRYKDAILTV